MKNAIFDKYRVIFGLVLLFGLLLRIVWLEKYPSSLYSDELSQGYNAYSILNTGKDEYGQFLPLSFRSFGDWKPPLQTYLIVPFIHLFGLNAISIRLPGAFFGTLSIYLIYTITNALIEYIYRSNTKILLHKRKISLLASFFLAISPWHILMSRSAMLVSIAMCCWMGGIYFYLSNKKPYRIYFSAIFFALSIYAYYGMRVVTPLTVILLLLWSFRSKQKLQIAIFAKAFVVGIVCLLPLVWAFIAQPDVVLGRAKTVSVFYDKGVSLKVWDLVAQDGVNMPIILARFLHNKPYHYAIDITRRFFQHLDGSFLILMGDTQLPFQIPNMGILYIIDLIFLMLGTIVLIKYTPQLSVFLGAIIFIAIIPSALTFVTPAANRTLQLLLPFSIVGAVGLVYIIGRLKGVKKFVAIFICAMGYGICHWYFLYNYTIILPKYHADWWHGGYKELVENLHQLEDKYETIYISGKASVPYIFILNYLQLDPVFVQNNIERDLNDDEYGFEHVDKIGKFEFPRYFRWETDGEKLQPNSLLAVLASEPQPSGDTVREVNKIMYPDGKDAFKIYEITN